jgi:hypothetical protein
MVLLGPTLECDTSDEIHPLCWREGFDDMTGQTGWEVRGKEGSLLTGLLACISDGQDP